VAAIQGCADALGPAPGKGSDDYIAFVREVLNDSIRQVQRLLRWVCDSFFFETPTGKDGKAPDVPGESSRWIRCPDLSIFGYTVLQPTRALIWFADG
jgi:hypothetical protein